MRRKLLGYKEEWLAGDFQAPAPLSNKKYLSVWRAHQNTDRSLVAMKLQQGAGIWTSEGKLLFYGEQCADIAFAGGSEIWLLENVYAKCGGGPGVAHALHRIQSGTWTSLFKLEICVPLGAVEYLVVSDRDQNERVALVTWLDQTEWGYVVVNLSQMKQVPISFRWDSPTLSPPALSPDEKTVVSCQYLVDRWWLDDNDDETAPSPGGMRQMGSISVHHLAPSQVSNHPVLVNLPAAWRPDRPNRSDWSMIWGPEFTGPREFRIWLPDATEKRLSLPLPPKVVIEESLRTERPWLD
jgi:hypothetical protein